jgi:hypothetical protein
MHGPPAGHQLSLVKDNAMNVFVLFAGGGPLVILTSHDSLADPVLLKRLAAKGIDKFLAYAIPLGLAKERYGLHFDVVAHDLSETDDLRVLDLDGNRALRLFDFAEMIGPIVHEREMSPA